jgi:hypothetical protein
VPDGTIKSSHFVTVGQTKEKKRSSTETLLAPYNVPEEVIKMVDYNQQVAETLQVFKEQIQPQPLKPKQKYQGITQDGAAFDFLQKHYGKEISQGIVDTISLRKSDPLLYTTLANELVAFNKANPDNQRTMSYYVPDKRTIMEKKAELVSRIFPDISFAELAKEFRSLARLEELKSSPSL